MKKQTANQKNWRAWGLVTLAIAGTTTLWAMNYNEDVTVGPDVHNLDVNGNVNSGSVVIDGPDTIFGANTLTGWSPDSGSMIIGNGNTAGGYTLLVGAANVNGGYGYGQAAIGENNTTASCSLVVGLTNYTEQSGSFAVGTGNTLWNVGYNSFALGKDNSVEGKASGALGFDNEVLGASTNPAIAIGEGLSVDGQTHGETKVVVGRYNDSSSSVAGEVFVVGIGADDNNRSNALEVYANGDVIISKAQGDISMGAFGY